VNTIDRTACKTLHADIEAALRAVAERHGLDLAVKGGSFSPNTYSPKIELRTKGAEAGDFARYAPLFGLAADSFGKQFVSNGAVYVVTGINPKADRFPILAERSSDRRAFKMTADAVKRGLL
jgi:hypothetical protein